MTPRGVDDYFPFLFIGNDGAVMILSGYFDESVRVEGPEPVAVAGFLFKAAGYKRFKERWHREVLRLPDRRQLKHFHMTDLYVGQGEYKGLSIAERVAILNRATAVIGATAFAATGTIFDAAEFAAVAPDGWAKYRGSIYTAACFFCLNAVGYWLRHDWDCHMDVLYVFERGYKYQDEANRVLNATAADEAARKRFRYRQHLFEEKDNEYGLQAADLLAWTLTKAIAVVGNQPKSLNPFRESLLAMVHALPERYKLYHFTGDPLRRFIVEQLTLDLEEAIPIDFGPRKPALK